MEAYDGPTELATVLPGAVFGPILTTDNIGSVGIVGRMVAGEMRGIPGSAWRSSTSVTSSMSTSGR